MADTISKTKIIAPAFKGDGSQITGLAAVANGASARLLIGQGTGSSPLWKDVSGAITIGATGLTAIDPALIQTATVALSSADILALHSAPKVLVAAPVAGKVLVPLDTIIQFKASGVAYLLGGAIAPVYHGATTPLTGASLAAATLLANASFQYRLGQDATAGGQALSSATGIDLYAATQDFTVGTGTAIVTQRYYVLTLG